MTDGAAPAEVGPQAAAGACAQDAGEGSGEGAARLRERLARVAREGAERFDPVGLRFVESLIAKAEVLDSEARARLLVRAAGRLDAFEAGFRKARAEATARVRELVAAKGRADAELRAALALGDFEAVCRGVRRRLRAIERAKQPPRLPWAARLRGEARAPLSSVPPAPSAAVEVRGASTSAPPAAPVAPIAMANGAAKAGVAAIAMAKGAPLAAPPAASVEKPRPQESASARSRALFRDSAERARAALAVARAADNLPEAAGPYNTQLLAARALQAMDALSPEYLRTFIAALDDLAALQALTAEPEPRKGKAKAAKKGGATKAKAGGTRKRA